VNLQLTAARLDERRERLAVTGLRSSEQFGRDGHLRGHRPSGY